jgi:hypothetical protein
LVRPDVSMGNKTGSAFPSEEDCVWRAKKARVELPGSGQGKPSGLRCSCGHDFAQLSPLPPPLQFNPPNFQVFFSVIRVPFTQSLKKAVIDTNVLLEL